MAHMKFSYNSSADHPFLSFMSFVLGFSYALSFIIALGAAFYGLNLVTGNRWGDFAFFAVLAVCLLFFQFLVNEAISKPAANKARPIITEQPEYIQTEAQPLHSQVTQKVKESKKAKKPAKKVYCKHCGSEIDSVTKKCTGCGKQYLNSRKIRKVIIRIAGIAVFAGLCYGAYFYHAEQLLERDNKIKELEESNSDLENKLERMSNRYFKSQEEYRQLQSDYSDVKEKAQFLDSHVVFTTVSAGEKYHAYDCYYIQGHDTNYWFKGDAILAGYEPCSYCQ